jgi:DNA-binding GntR family transcriptional regulator
MSSNTMGLRRPSHVRLVDQVRQSLEEAILAGQIQPGEHLAETRIGEQLNVSRTTVREALLMLEQQGLVVSVPRRGMFVTRLSEQDALDLAFLRVLLEGFAVVVGRSRIDDDLIAQLKSQIEDMLACEIPGELPRLIEIDLAFHGRLIELADSPRLKAAWSSLNSQLGALMLRGIESHDFSTGDVADLHADLLAAIRAGNSEGMVRGLLEHYVASEHAWADFGRQISDLITATAVGYESRAAHMARDIEAG